MPKGYDPHDAFYKKAKSQNLRARSAFKLDEIQQRWRLIRTGDAVVDLGAAPGGFLQVLAQIVGPTGRIVGVDREEIRPIGGVVATIHSDVMAPELLPAIRAALGRPDAHVVASDLAPKTTGIRDTDEHIGVVAQEVQRVIPEAVTQNAKGYLLVNNDPVLWSMVNAIQQQQREIEAQQKLIREQSRAMKSLIAEVRETRKALRQAKGQKTDTSSVLVAAR